jgi:DNA-binding winged helix-turn-helix (wHTH) protein
VFDGRTREVRRADQPIQLSPKAFDVLGLLIGRAPAAVSKEEIVRAAWSVSYVSDASLTNVVSELRSALGDDARNPRIIRTVHGYGYALSAAVTTREEPSTQSPAWRLAYMGRHVLLAPGDHVIGRDPAAEILVDDVAVSRRHARIRVGSTSLVVEDLGSRNGTFVNGVQITGPTQLHDGDVVSLGTVALVLERLAPTGSTETLPPRQGP